MLSHCYSAFDESPAHKLLVNRHLYLVQSERAVNNRIVFTAPLPNRPVEPSKQLVPVK